MTIIALKSIVNEYTKIVMTMKRFEIALTIPLTPATDLFISSEITDINLLLLLLLNPSNPAIKYFRQLELKVRNLNYT